MDNSLVANLQKRFPGSQLWPVISFAAYHLLLVLLLLLSDFDGIDLLTLLYMELIAIGLVALLRLLTAILVGIPFHGPGSIFDRLISVLKGLWIIGFFLLTFSAFAFFVGAMMVLAVEELDLAWEGVGKLSVLMVFCIGLLLCRYVIDFLYFTLARGDYKNASIARLFFAPYLRGYWLLITLGVAAYLLRAYPDQPMLGFTLGVLALKTVLDLFNLLKELRLARLGSATLEEKKPLPDERTRRRQLILGRVYAVCILAVFAAVLAIIARAGWQQYRLESALEARGEIVTGTVIGKSTNNHPEDETRVIAVSYTWQSQPFSSRYAVPLRRWEALAIGDVIEVTVLSNNPGLSQLTEYIGTPFHGRPLLLW